MINISIVTFGRSVKLGPGTLYRSLKEMAAEGLIENVAGLPGEDPRRRVYGITKEGRALVRSEAIRLAGIVEVARRSRVLPGTS